MIDTACINNNKGKIIKAVFNKKTAFNPLVSGDPSKIFQERFTYGRLVEYVIKQNGIKKNSEPKIFINDL